MNLNFLKKPVGDVFAPTPVAPVEIGSLKTVKQSIGSTIDPNNPLTRDDRSLFKTDVKDYRYAKDADELLKLLSKFDPDVSTGIWNFLRLANSGLKVIGLNKDMMPDMKVQQAIDSVLFRFSGLNNFKEWSLYNSIEGTANIINKYILLRGGCGLELVLNKSKTAKKLAIVDPIKVHFKHIKTGVYIPFQKKADNSEVRLDIPTFFWQLLDPDADSPYETPPFLPVIQAVMFNISVMQDLERIVKRTAYPRIAVKIIESTLRKFAPVSAQTDEEEMAKWLKTQRETIGSALNNLSPQDAAVFFDSIDISTLEVKHNATIDFRPLKEVIDQRIIAGLKSLPTILGRQFGSSQTIGGVESLLYAKSIKSIQDVSAFLLSRSLTLALQLEGVSGVVQVKYNPVSLRPENELEAFKGLEQARVLEQLSLGLITDEEAAAILTGNPYLPKGYQRLSGTMFYNNTSDPENALATRNPTAEETAGNGRG